MSSAVLRTRKKGDVAGVDGISQGKVVGEEDREPPGDGGVLGSDYGGLCTPR